MAFPLNSMPTQVKIFDISIMKSVWFALFLNIAQNLAAPSQEVAPRIVGGEDCDVKDHPFIVAILTKMLCGGSLVKFDFVLTAAHCAETQTLSTDKSMVRAGYTYGSDLVQTRRIDKAYIHEDYVPDLLDDATELRYDIALIKLKKPFDPSPVAQLVKLPTKNMEIKCEKILALGIGKTNHSEEGPQSSAEVLSRHLKCVELTVITTYKCKQSFDAASIDDGSVLCTWEKGKDTCVGDSGGPVVCDGVQVGIVSYGPTECGETEQAGTYTRVDKYLDWISDHLKPKKKKSFFSFGFRRQKIPSRAYTNELSICITLLGIIAHIIL